MKKHFRILLLLCLVCLLTASCAPRETEQLNKSQETQSYVDEIIEQNGRQSENFNPPDTASSPQIDEIEEKLPAPVPQIENEADNSEAVKTDIDLTALSSTMVYAEVYNIMMDPDNYVGKTIRGNGVYNSFYYEEMDRYFHYFIITDATGCCPQGLDFVWNGEHIYPDDYPELGENIELTGVFIKGEIEGLLYYYLAVDNISVLK